MFNTYKELPEDYKLVWKVDFKKDKKAFWLLNIGTIILFIPFFIIYSAYFLNMDTFIMGLAIAMFLSIVIIIVHEYIHAVFFRLGKNVNVKFKFHGFAASAGDPDSYFQKQHYLMVGLAPAIIINLILLIVLLFVKGLAFEVVFWSLAIHFAGCIGDFYIALKLRNYPQDLLVRDYGIGMEFFSKEG